MVATVSVHVTGWVWDHSRVRLGDLLVLLALADHAKRDGTGAWPSVKTLSEYARITERQVQRCLRRLEELGEIERTGTSKFGTSIYSFPRYIESRAGGDNLSPGGDIHDSEGVTFTTSGVTQMSPDPLEDPSRTRPEPTHARGTVVALSGSALEVPAGGAPWKVDRVYVTEAEGGLARAVLAMWNERTGQSLTSKDWLAKIILRIREHPELDFDSHEHVVTVALNDPWWSGPASPSVVYGNGAQFERCVEHVRAGGASSSKPARFGRGLSARQIGEMFGEGGAA